MDASGHRRSLLLDHTALAHPPFHTLVETSPKTADRLYRSHILVLLHPVPRPVDRRLPVVVHGVPLLLRLAGGHLEDHLHVVRRAAASNPSMQVSSARGGYEVVVLARSELETSRCWTETPEGDGELELPVGLVADGDHPRVRLADPTAVVLLLAHVVDDVPLSLLPPSRTPAMPCHWADDVQLVVLEGQVARVHVHDVVRVVDPEDRVGAVPVEAVHGDRADLDDEQGDERDESEEGGGAGLHHDAAQGTRLLSLLSRDDSQTIVTSLLASSDTTSTACQTCISRELFQEIHSHY